MNKFQVVRAILDEATSDSGRLENATDILANYAKEKAIHFHNFLNSLSLEELNGEDGRLLTNEQLYLKFDKENNL